eukprot:Platyproteum_vivax@DN5133_c0_g1_i1.p1
MWGTAKVIIRWVVGGDVAGMGFITGLLLLYMGDEDAFGMLVLLLEKYGMKGLFEPNLPLLDKCFFQFTVLLQSMMPNLANHLEMECVDPTMYLSQWFITLFTYSFSFEAVVRVWDIFLVEGFKTLFKVSLAVMKLLHDTLLSQSFERILHTLKHTPATIAAETLIETSLGVKVDWKMLEALEEDYRQQNGQKAKEPAPQAPVPSKE